MRADRELLELAAKAAGYEVDFSEPPVNGWYPHGYHEDGDVLEWWNPLIDDGDALRLAVKLGMRCNFDIGYLSLDSGWSTRLRHT